MASMFQTPGLQSMMDQMNQNPQLMQNMMQSPYMQSVMNQMAQNPELMSSVSRDCLPRVQRKSSEELYK